MPEPEGIVAVMRGSDPIRIEAACRALNRGGVRSIEITFTVPGALDVIDRLRHVAEMNCGAGTVTDIEQARRAVEHGAQFLVTPAYLPEIAQFAQTRGVACVIGAMSPTEVLAAWRAGATQVKLFPIARLGGPAYLRDLAGPFPDIRFAPSGGIELEDVGSYALPNVASLGLGTTLAPADSVAKGDLHELEGRARRAVAGFVRIKP